MASQGVQASLLSQGLQASQESLEKAVIQAFLDSQEQVDIRVLPAIQESAASRVTPGTAVHSPASLATQEIRASLETPEYPDFREKDSQDHRVLLGHQDFPDSAELTAAEEDS